MEKEWYKKVIGSRKKCARTVGEWVIWMVLSEEATLFFFTVIVLLNASSWNDKYQLSNTINRESTGLDNHKGLSSSPTCQDLCKSWAH
jgi:hypothetical protein